MADDRYAPPTAELGDPTRERGTGRIDLAQTFREAWAATWEHFGLLLGFSIVSVVVGGLASLTIVGIILVLPVLAYGGARFALNVLEDKGEVADLFSGFADYVHALATMFVLGLLLALLYLAGQSLSYLGERSGSGFLMAVGGLVALYWNFGVMPRLAFASYYAVDQQMGPVDAIQASWYATRDQKLICTSLAILGVITILIGVALLIVGLIPAVILVFLMQASAYRQLAGR